MPKQQKFGGGYELVPGGRISSRTSNKIIGQGRSWSHEAGPEHAKTTKIWGRVRAGPRRQDQLVPQKNCSAGYELVLSGRMSSYLKKHVLCRALRKFVRQGTSWSQKAGLARTTKKLTSWCKEVGSARIQKNVGEGMSWSPCGRVISCDAVVLICDCIKTIFACVVWLH